MPSDNPVRRTDKLQDPGQPGGKRAGRNGGGSGGRLPLRAGWGQGPDLVRRGAARLNERRLKVEVEDSGRGIPASATGKIFNPFFTTKPGGTGLGLALTHKIVGAHGGASSFRGAPRARAGSEEPT